MVKKKIELQKEQIKNRFNSSKSLTASAAEKLNNVRKETDILPITRPQARQLKQVYNFHNFKFYTGYLNKVTAIPGYKRYIQNFSLSFRTTNR
jgi:hypothetical protein